MAYAVVHMKKMQMVSIRGIQSHNKREHTPKTNPDIDSSRTEQNFDIVPCSDYSKKIKTIIEHNAATTKTVRKDAVVLCNFIITSDEKTMKKMSLKKQKEFFTDSVNWFSNRYGAENIVNATVHMDETTPHLHIGVVSIIKNRLSAKTLFDRKELTAIQTDFANQVGKRYGLERGKEGSERTHLSEMRFKIQTTKEELRQTQSKASKIVFKAKRDIELLKDKINALNAEFEAKQEYIKNMRFVYEQNLSPIKKKNLLGKETVTLTREDYDNLMSFLDTAYQVKTVSEKFNRDLERLDKLKEYDLMKSENLKLKKELACQKSSHQIEVNKLKSDLKQISNSLANIMLSKIKIENEVKKAVEKYPILQEEFNIKTNRQKNNTVNRMSKIKNSDMEL